MLQTGGHEMWDGRVSDREGIAEVLKCSAQDHVVGFSAPWCKDDVWKDQRQCTYYSQSTTRTQIFKILHLSWPRLSLFIMHTSPNEKFLKFEGWYCIMTTMVILIALENLGFLPVTSATRKMLLSNSLFKFSINVTFWVASHHVCHLLSGVANYGLGFYTYTGFLWHQGMSL